MRGLILGLLIGGFLALLPDWIRGHGMLPNIPFLPIYLIAFGILLVLFYRPILRPIEKKFPKLLMKLNNFFFKPLDIESKNKEGNKK